MQHSGDVVLDRRNLHLGSHEPASGRRRARSSSYIPAIRPYACSATPAIISLAYSSATVTAIGLPDLDTLVNTAATHSTASGEMDSPSR